MNYLNKLKNNEIQVPINIGQLISYIPMSFKPKIGKMYRQRKKEIIAFEQLEPCDQKDFIYKRMKSIVDYAYAAIPFYKRYYDESGFNPNELKTFNDIVKIPVVNKSILQRIPLEERSSTNQQSYIVNTGGSSGHPLSFYIQPSSIGHEWAHMYTIWEKLGYKPSDLRLYIAGRGNVRNGVEYDFARHTLVADMYKPYDSYSENLIDILKKHPCYYLHGYPSALYELALYCQKNEILRNLLCKTLKGAFLGSEYPYAHFRDVIEETFNISSVSWYGHTERCVLAYEKEQKFIYYPFQTYGYSEAILNGDDTYSLIGTSYYNLASPLIRYDTEDKVNNPVFKSGFLESFRISDGRSGQFVVDKKGNNISLTGLIFGRHHKLFDYCSHIQVSQLINGEMILLYVLKDSSFNLNVAELFDSNNVDIDITYQPLREPIKTISGKINLLVNYTK